MHPAATSFRFPAVLLAAVAITAHAADLETPGRIEAVTVYRGQALVTRVIDLGAAQGENAALREVIVTDLPGMIDAGSMHAEGADGAMVRSVRFRARPVAEAGRDEVRRLDTLIAQIVRKQEVNARMDALTKEIRAHLDSLSQFVAPSATVELRSGVLNAEVLEKLSGYLLAQRERLAQRELELSAEAKSLRDQLALQQAERGKLAAGNDRQVNEAIVFVATPTGRAGSLRLRYLVNGASWAPSYNARRGPAAPGEQTLTLEYYASIQQTSGEDWSGVSMTLSTATPALTATPPSLDSMRIGLAPAPQEKAEQLAHLGYDAAFKELADKRREADQVRNRAPSVMLQSTETATGRTMVGAVVSEQRDALRFLNDAADDLQLLDLVTRAKISRTRAPTIRQREEGLSVTYAVAGKTSLPSRADNQLVQIASLPINATFSKIATPVLTEYVYDQARAVNTSDIVLLAGPVTAYADGAFVGGADIPTVAIGETFTLGFGIDSSLRASRQLVERTESIQGGNRIVELTYRLAIENFGGAPASIQLMDRRPVPSGTDIQLTVASTSEEPSTSPDYTALMRSNGVLRWDVDVPAQSIALKAKPVEYKLKLEYDKQMNLVGMSN